MEINMYDCDKSTYFALRQKLSGMLAIQGFHNMRLNKLLTEQREEIAKVTEIRKAEIESLNRISIQMDEQISRLKCLITAYETEEYEEAYSNALLNIMLMMEEQLKGNNHD